LILIFFSIFLGQVEFGGYDSSLLIDLGWRQHLGQLPYKDFPCMLPPGFYLMARVAVDIFGVHWWSFTVVNALLWFCLTGLGLRLIFSVHLPLSMERKSFIAKIFVMALAIPLLTTNHIWHSTMASQGVVLFLLILYLEFQCIEISQRLTPALFFAGLFTASALWLSKPNTAFPALIASGLLSLGCRERVRFFLVWSGTVLGGAAFAFGALKLLHITPRGDLFLHARE